jgi:Flp pilus assembly protein TadD
MCRINLCCLTLFHILLGMLTATLAADKSAAAPQSARPSRTPSESTVYRNTVPGVKYLGSKVCAACHKDIYDNFSKTGMGRSMSPVTRSALEKVPAPVTVFAKDLNRRFQVYRQGSDLYQSESVVDADGKEVFKSTHKLEFIVGSGANGFTTVVRRGNYLFEAPLSFYTKANSWGLSPGYEFRDYGFDRPIQEGCVACHSGRPQPVPDQTGLYRDPPFQELAIACESCHGPGELHVREREAGTPVPDHGDRSIVNPGRLPAWLADNICMYCHQAGDVRILQSGKDYLDFRPGAPLDDTLAVLMVPLKREAPMQSDLLEHYFSMTLSKCYRQSNGKLSCLSCHDPHLQPTKQEAAAYYRSKCLVCHTDSSCTVPLPMRRRQSPPDDCTGCHMPKRDVKIIAHSALTNHRIIADDTEPYPEMAFHLGTPETPDLIHLSAIPDRQKDSIPPITLFEAYGELMDSAPVYRKHYETLLGQLAKQEPDNVPVLEALAKEAMQQGTPGGESEAIKYFSRAIQLGARSPEDFQALAVSLGRAGRLGEAIDLLRRAIRVAPYESELYQSLAKACVMDQKPEEAADTLRKALELFPQNADIRLNLSRIEESMGSH